ncbi:Hypothetical protein FKW44_012881, partial [Caligus rogercresseyi]
VKCVSRTREMRPFWSRKKRLRMKKTIRVRTNIKDLKRKRNKGQKKKILKKGNTEMNSQKNLAKTRARLLKTQAKIWIGTTVVV